MTFVPRQKLTAKALNDLLALATEARNTALTAQNVASNKADAASLAAKADKTAVEASLAAKADKAAVEASLAA